MEKLFTNDDLRSSLSILPLSIWSVEKGVGSFLIFDAGLKIPHKNKENEIAYKGQLHIWIYLCDWELYHKDILLLSSDSEDKNAYDNILKRMIGLEVTEIKELISKEKLELAFSNNYHIYLKSNLDVYEKDDDLCMIFIEEQYVISYSPENGFYVESNCVDTSSSK